MTFWRPVGTFRRPDMSYRPPRYDVSASRYDVSVARYDVLAARYDGCAPTYAILPERGAGRDAKSCVSTEHGEGVETQYLASLRNMAKA